jgi:hypothetical protein
MENAPVITLSGQSRYPGAEPEVYERFSKWRQEVYLPVNMRVQQRKGLDYYQIVRESPLFPSIVAILHYENHSGWVDARKNPEAQSISNEFGIWMKRGILDFIWSAVYQLVKSYRSDSSNPEGKLDTRIENAPILHLEAYRLTAEDSGKYDKWFIDYCSKIFVPLFMKQAGLKGYDYFKYAGVSVNFDNLLEKEYPTYLSAIYFENIKDFENFEKSNELAVCKKTLRDIFPRGLKYEWYVQYQLIQSWRK